jgi:hypothetical protein
MEVSQETVLKIIQHEINCPEILLYLACFFWSKNQVRGICDVRLQMMFAMDALELENDTSVFVPSAFEDIYQGAQNTDIRRVMNPFLPHIRLLSMKPRELEYILYNFAVFTAEEADFIYNRGIIMDDVVPPENFLCTQTVVRCIEYPHETINLDIYGIPIVSVDYANHTKNVLYYTPPSDRHILSSITFQCATQVKPERTPNTGYFEHVTFVVKDLDGSLMQSTANEYKNHVPYNSCLSYTFYPPDDFRRQPTQFYGQEPIRLSVYAVFHVSGTYPAKKIGIILSLLNTATQMIERMYVDPLQGISTQVVYPG